MKAGRGYQDFGSELLDKIAVVRSESNTIHWKKKDIKELALFMIESIKLERIKLLIRIFRLCLSSFSRIKLLKRIFR